MSDRPSPDSANATPDAAPNRPWVKTVTVVFCFLVIPLWLLWLSLQPAIASTPKHYDQLKFAPLPAIQLPAYEQFKLRNGMSVILMEDHDLPLVSGSLLVKTGSQDETASQAGLASLTGSILRSGGSQLHPADRLNEMLEQKAASIESSIGINSGSVGFNSLSEDFVNVFSLFSEIIQSPALPQDKLDLAKLQVRGGIARRNDQPNGIVAREFRKLIYGDQSPYGRTVEYSTLDRINQSDIQTFYQKAFRPENFILGIIGDINPREARELIESKFANWSPAPAKQTPKSPQAITQQKTKGIFVASQPQLTQSSIWLGHLGGKVNDADYPAMTVVNEILSGFGGRLFNEVRSRQGLAYSVYASWSAQFDYPGLFIAGGDTKSESTVPFIQGILKEIDRIRTQPVTPDELQRAKDSVENSFIFNFDAPSKVLSRILRYEYFGYPKDYLFQYQKAVAATTTQDLQRAAQTNLRPDRLITVIVGNPTAINPPLTTLNQPINTLDIKIPPP